MPEAGKTEATDWQAVLAKAAAFLCLQQADMKSATMLDKAEFLMRFGLSRPHAAQLLGTSDESLRVLANQRAKRTTSKKSPAKKRGAARGR